MAVFLCLLKRTEVRVSFFFYLALHFGGLFCSFSQLTVGIYLSEPMETIASCHYKVVLGDRTDLGLLVSMLTYLDISHKCFGVFLFFLESFQPKSWSHLTNCSFIDTQ